MYHYVNVMKPITKISVVAAFATMIGGCALLKPEPVETKAVEERAANDRVKMFNKQEPVVKSISLNEAIARALKYNLDLRLKKMEAAVNSDLYDVSKYDLLPNVILGAGYLSRDNYSGGDKRDLYSPRGSQPSNARPPDGRYSTSSDLNHVLNSADFSWNVLDFGVSYFRAKQRADEFLIAEERKRRVIQTIVYDTRFAYLRAVAAQKLAVEAETVMKQANEAIQLSRAAESRGAIPIQTALAYRRALLDAIALLNLRRQELDYAKAELAALMSTPTTEFTLVDTPDQPLRAVPASLPILEDQALINRPELREEDYKKRISANETRRQLMQALPN